MTLAKLTFYCTLNDAQHMHSTFCTKSECKSFTQLHFWKQILQNQQKDELILKVILCKCPLIKLIYTSIFGTFTSNTGLMTSLVTCRLQG